MKHLGSTLLSFLSWSLAVLSDLVLDSGNATPGPSVCWDTSVLHCDFPQIVLGMEQALRLDKDH